MSIAENLAQVRAVLAAHQRGGKPATLIAVTKNHDVAAMREAIAAGVADIGENRVQEAAAKFAQLGPEASAVRWHLIGHLQSNKAKAAVRIFDVIHSLDSEHLLRAVDEAAGKLGKRQDVMIQVNLAREPQKSGCDVDALPALLTLARSLPSLRLVGLMLIAPIAEDPEQCRPLFREMRALADRCRGEAAPWLLSMGMTHDFAVAVDEGATMVRIGTAIFGARQY